MKPDKGKNKYYMKVDERKLPEFLNQNTILSVVKF